MRSALAILTVCGLAALAGRADDPCPEPPGGGKAELKNLKGKWTVTKAVFKNRELRAPPGLTYTFDGDKLTRTTPIGKGKGNIKGKDDRSIKYKVKLDTKKKPYKIEMIPEGAKTGQVAIYKIEKGELYLALGRLAFGKGAKAAEAPKDFSGDAGPVYVMTREKEAK
jgi:uncharacterized protein (TIGR03067 family)